MSRITNGHIISYEDDDDMEGFEFFQDVVDIIKDSGLVSDADTLRKNYPVANFVQPNELERLLDLRLPDEPANKEDLLKFCKTVIHYSVKTCHPLFASRLYHGVDGYGLAGAWLTEALNTSESTFEVAPVFTLLETHLLEEFVRFAGWNQGDGLFCPGGSIANMYGLSLARFKMFPEVKIDGMQNLPLMSAFISEDAHYSLTKGAIFMGMGQKSIVTVKSDAKGCLNPEKLEKEILRVKSENKTPFFVCATTGTTVLGAYDPVAPIADLCEKYGLWLHIDGAWGGAALFSKNQRHLLEGIERADSLTLDLHKMSGIPFHCTFFLTKHKGVLRRCNGLCAEYLFQPDTYYDTSYDTGDDSIQCSRKVDGLKLWLSWRGRGLSGVQQKVDQAFEMSKEMTRKLKNTEGFRLVLPEFQCAVVCFWYIPPSLRKMPDGPEFWNKLNGIAPKIKSLLVKKGSMFIAYQPLGSKKFANFLRVTFHCVPAITKEDVNFIIEEIERVGKDL